MCCEYSLLTRFVQGAKEIIFTTMKQTLFIILGVSMVLGALLFIANSRKESDQNGQEGKMLVVGTFYPLAHFAKEVGQEHVNVVTLTPAGVEPHDYEPTPQQLRLVQSADLFLLNGGGFESWAGNIIKEREKAGRDSLSMVEKISVFLPGPLGEKKVNDPHIWLDPLLAQKEVDTIRDALITLDPAHREDYTMYASSYSEKLRALDRSYEAALSACQRREIIVSHEAFGYLANRYGFKLISITGLSPEEEPSLRHIQEIINTAKEKQITYIFDEPLFSSPLAATIARELNAKVLPLNPIEGLTAKDVRAGEDYLSLMGENLKNLRLALLCK